MFAVAPVLNLSGRDEVDPLRITDLVVSELQSFPDVQVVPVNRVLAELVRRGRSTVETPSDASELARATGADVVLVFAITEYDPYDPPVVGLTGQWYRREGHSPRDAAHASSNDGPTAQTGMDRTPPDSCSVALQLQVQRVYNAADEEVAKKLRDYAARRDKHNSPYEWRRFRQSQELYVRYCGWSLIETMLALDAGGLEAAPPHGVRS